MKNVNQVFSEAYYYGDALGQYSKNFGGLYSHVDNKAQGSYVPDDALRLLLISAAGAPVLFGLAWRYKSSKTASLIFGAFGVLASMAAASVYDDIGGIEKNALFVGMAATIAVLSSVAMCAFNYYYPEHAAQGMAAIVYPAGINVPRPIKLAREFMQDTARVY